MAKAICVRLKSLTIALLKMLENGAGKDLEIVIVCPRAVQLQINVGKNWINLFQGG